MSKIVEVKYCFYSDFYYRINKAILKSEVYRLDFVDWVKAGIAFNTRSDKEPSRKILNFVNIYDAVYSGSSNASTLSILRNAVMSYYEDIFQLYQCHLLAQLKIEYKRSKGTVIEPRNLVILPCFELCKDRLNFLSKLQVDMQKYESKYTNELMSTLSTIYVKSGSDTYRYMSLYFDYGCKREGNGILLEVSDGG